MLVRISIVTRVTIYFVTDVAQLPTYQAAPTSANATKNSKIPNTSTPTRFPDNSVLHAPPHSLTTIGIKHPPEHSSRADPSSSDEFKLISVIRFLTEMASSRHATGCRQSMNQ